MLLKKIAFCLFSIFLFTPAFAWKTPSSLVADAQSGYVLHAKNADVKQYPASLTKVMTLYITFDALEKGYLHMDDLIPVSKHAARQPRSKLGLKAGSVMTVKEAILALIVKSANDAAVVLAEALAPSEEEFAQMMTSFAHDLGLHDTTFKNASGLHDPEQVTSAKDMAILAIAMMNHFPQYYPLFSTKSFKFDGKTYYSHNSILLYYKGAEGFKTGFISAVGYNIVSTAERDGRTLVGVVIGQDSAALRDKQMKNLLDKGFAKAKTKEKELKKSANNPFFKKAYISSSHKQKYDAILKKNIAQTQLKVAQMTAKDKTTLIASIPMSPVEEENITIEQGDYTPAEWSIQVGAFNSEEKAKKLALSAQETLHLKTISIQTPPYKKMFRSRLVGFETKEDAVAACNALKTNAFSCLAIAPNKKEP